MDHYFIMWIVRITYIMKQNNQSLLQSNCGSSKTTSGEWNTICEMLSLLTQCMHFLTLISNFLWNSGEWNTQNQFFSHRKYNITWIINTFQSLFHVILRRRKNHVNDLNHHANHSDFYFKNIERKERLLSECKY